jgi:hypothetical protein
LGGSFETIFVALGLYLAGIRRRGMSRKTGRMIDASVIAPASGTVQGPSARSGRE